MDHLYTLNELTPKIRCFNRNEVDPSLIFGLDTKLFSTSPQMEIAERLNGHHHQAETHHDEIETATIILSGLEGVSRLAIDQALSMLPKDRIYRVKGFITFVNEHAVILNWAFGRSEIVPYDGDGRTVEDTVRVTMMGERGEVKNQWAKKFAEAIGAIEAQSGCRR